MKSSEEKFNNNNQIINPVRQKNKSTENVNKSNFEKEDNYKLLILEKDRTINELKSTLEVEYYKSDNRNEIEK